jgi:hypothetical protein
MGAGLRENFSTVLTPAGAEARWRKCLTNKSDFVLISKTCRYVRQRTEYL